MRRRSEAGNTLPALALLLALLVGAGAWNYWRNSQADAKEYRPFRGYTDQEIAQLTAAYEADRDHDKSRWEKVERGRVAVKDKAFLGDQVQEFARVQRISESKRAVRDQVAESQATLKLLQAEKRKRAQEKKGIWRVLQLALRF
jgi:hypothetical protein